MRGFFINNMKNYRKLYAEYYGISINDGYHIHHINRNRNDNRIENLILLPCEVHSKLHWCIDNNIESGIKDMLKMNPHRIGFCSGIVKTFNDILPDLQYWTTAKEMEDLRKFTGQCYSQLPNYNRFR